jgi:hypothetical protein
MKGWILLLIAFALMSCGPSIQERRAHYQELRAESDRIKAERANICNEYPHCGFHVEGEPGTYHDSPYIYLMLQDAQAEAAADAANPDR